MQSISLVLSDKNDASIAERIALWFARRRLQKLCAEANYELAEIERCKARITALRGAINKEFHQIYLMKQK